MTDELKGVIPERCGNCQSEIRPLFESGGVWLCTSCVILFAHHQIHSLVAEVEQAKQLAFFIADQASQMQKNYEVAIQLLKSKATADYDYEQLLTDTLGEDFKSSIDVAATELEKPIKALNPLEVLKEVSPINKKYFTRLFSKPKKGGQNEVSNSSDKGTVGDSSGKRRTQRRVREASVELKAREGRALKARGSVSRDQEKMAKGGDTK